MEPLIWKRDGGEIEIKSLKGLSDIIVNIGLENVDREIMDNLDNVVKWLEENFPRELDLITTIKAESKEFTPQQVRELMARKLRKLI
jgi:hypothetical protein